MKIKRLTEDSLVARFLGWLAAMIIRHRRLMFYPQLVLCVGIDRIHRHFPKDQLHAR